MSDDSIQDSASTYSGSAVTSESQSLPGTTLAARRQALGLSIEEVAAKLKLAPRQIVCIEADNYSALPGISIVTGFVRAYAKVLGLDPAPLVAQLPREESMVSRVLPIKQELATPFSEARLRASGKSGAPSRKFLPLLLLVLIGVVVFGAQQTGMIPHFERASVPEKTKDTPLAMSEEQPKPESTEAAANVVVQESQATPAASASVARTDAAAPASEAKETRPQSVPASEAPVAAPAMVQAPAVSEAASAVAPPSGANDLILRMREDSWVEVKRASGGVVFSRIVKAGNSETINITEPVTLTIGNVHGVEANWRGAPLELKAGKANTARLQLK